MVNGSKSERRATSAAAPACALSSIPEEAVGGVDAERLVKLDMPELAVHPDQCRIIEVHDPTTDEWRRASIEKFSVDGRCQLQWTDDQSRTEWADLTRMRYRWVARRARNAGPSPVRGGRSR